MMNISKAVRNVFAHEDLNFLVTNRIPRLAVTHFMGWFSKIKVGWVRDASIATWKLFTDLDLSEAKKQRFDSLHDCFVRELREGARVVDHNPEVMTSPCDAIVGACGKILNGQVFQAKGFPYSLSDLLGQQTDTSAWADGQYVTLRLTSAMYHRFHAPYTGAMKAVHYLAGDTWNVNPIALKRVEKLFCKNERAVLALELGSQKHKVALVPVAAILVASIRLHGLNTLFHTRYKGQTDFSCNVEFTKGQELGWFEHGSTIIVFAPNGFVLADQIFPGSQIKMGSPLMHLPAEPHSNQSLEGVKHQQSSQMHARVPDQQALTSTNNNIQASEL
ncbi:Psd Phosphatidylserine decarboxylase [Burkholderiaceae bacterium]